MKKKRCKLCGKWFPPNPKAAERQRVCGVCQEERIRLASKAFREKNPNYYREATARKKLLEKIFAGEGGAEQRSQAAKIDWVEMQKAIGLELAIALEEIYKQIHNDRNRSVK